MEKSKTDKKREARKEDEVEERIILRQEGEEFLGRAVDASCGHPNVVLRDVSFECDDAEPLEEVDVVLTSDLGNISKNDVNGDRDPTREGVHFVVLLFAEREDRVVVSVQTSESETDDDGFYGELRGESEVVDLFQV